MPLRACAADARHTPPASRCRTPPPLLLLLLLACAALLAARGAEAACANCALSLGGNPQRVCAVDVAWPTSAVTVTMWVRYNGGNSDSTFIGYAAKGGSANEFMVRNVNDPFFYRGSSNAQKNNLNLPANVWTHIAFTWASAGGLFRMYVNGSLFHTTGALKNGVDMESPGALCFGADQDSYAGTFTPAQHFTGLMEDVAVFNTVLSAGEIASVMANGVDARTASVFYLLRFDSCGGTTVLSDDASHRAVFGLNGSPSFTSSFYSYASLYSITPDPTALRRVDDAASTQVTLIGQNFAFMNRTFSTRLSLNGLSFVGSPASVNDTHFVVALPKPSQMPSFALLSPIDRAGSFDALIEFDNSCNVSKTLTFGGVIANITPSDAALTFAQSLTLTLNGTFADPAAGSAASQVLFVSYRAANGRSVNATLVSVAYTSLVVTLDPTAQATAAGLTYADVFGVALLRSTDVAVLSLRVASLTYGNVSSTSDATRVRLTPTIGIDSVSPSACYVTTYCVVTVRGFGLGNSSTIAALTLGGVDIRAALSAFATNGSWLQLSFNATAIGLSAASAAQRLLVNETSNGVGVLDGAIRVFNCSTPSGSAYNGSIATDRCLCAPGSIASGSSGNCVACAAGSYSASWNSTRCTNCSAGSFANVTGSTACTMCAAGSYAARNSSTACASCAAGQYADAAGRSVCANCTAGSFANGSANTACLQCSAGSYAARSASTSCTACTAGAYAAAAGLSCCANCTAGSYSSVSASTACTLCSPGSYAARNASTACSNCAAGAYAAVSGLSVCTNCTAGSYSNVSASTACSHCSPGSYAARNASTTCTDCAAGSYATVSGLSVCTNCTAGSYSNVSASTACSQCSPGSYAAQPASTTCTDCAAGSYADAPGQSLCANCTTGTYSSASASTACSQCSPGSHAALNASTTCVDCASGSFAGNTGASVCTDCAAGEYSASTGQSACVACDRGSIASATGRTTCDACPLGSDTASSGATRCDDCAAGRFANTTGTPQCLLCSAGTIGTTTGATGCDACALNTYSPNAGLTTCSTCPPSFFTSSSGSAFCESGRFVVTSVSPSVCTQALCTLTVSGDGFYNDTLITLGSTQFAARDNCTVTSTLLTCHLRRIPDSLYVNVSVYNSDGDSSSLFEPLYLTDDCPFPGQFGRGVDCMDCPEGGVCPGGYRIWPQPGWWNTGEASGYVERCIEPSACLGGRYSACREGSEGYVCGTCSLGYYSTSGTCRVCGNSDARTTLLFILIGCMSLLVLCCTFASDAVIGTIEYVIFCLQVLWATTATAGAYLPDPLQSVLTQFSLFAGDVTFVQPECFNPGQLQGFSLLFFVNVGFLVGSMVPFILISALGVYLRLRIVRWCAQRRGRRVPARFDAWYRLEMKDRILRGVIVLTAFGYFNLNVLSWDALNCRRDQSGVYRLSKLPELVCGEGIHRYMIPLAVVLQLVLIFVPVFAFSFLFRTRRRARQLVGAQSLELEFESRMGKMMHMLELRASAAAAAKSSSSSSSSLSPSAAAAAALVDEAPIRSGPALVAPDDNGDAPNADAAPADQPTAPAAPPRIVLEQPAAQRTPSSHSLVSSSSGSSPSPSSPRRAGSGARMPSPAGAARRYLSTDQVGQSELDADERDALSFLGLGAGDLSARSTQSMVQRARSLSAIERAELESVLASDLSVSGDTPSGKLLDSLLAKVASRIGVEDGAGAGAAAATGKTADDSEMIVGELVAEAKGDELSKALPESSKLVYLYLVDDYHRKGFWFGALNFVLDWSFAVSSTFLGPYTVPLFVFNWVVLFTVLGVIIGLKPFQQQSRNFAYFTLMVVSIIGALVSMLADPAIHGPGAILTGLSYVVLVFLVLFFLSLIGMFANLIPALERRLKPIPRPRCCRRGARRTASTAPLTRGSSSTLVNSLVLGATLAKQASGPSTRGRRRGSGKTDVELIEAVATTAAASATSDRTATSPPSSARDGTLGPPVVRGRSMSHLSSASASLDTEALLALPLPSPRLLAAPGVPLSNRLPAIGASPSRDRDD